MTRKFTFLLMALLALAGFKSWGQENVLSEGFESSTFPPDGWTAIHVAGGNSWTRYANTFHEGTACARVDDSYHDDYLITPQLTPQVGESLSFYLSGGNWVGYDGTTLTVEVSITDTDASSFTTVLNTYISGAYATMGATFANKIIDLSAFVGQNIYIAFHAIVNNGSEVLIDDVTGVSLAGANTCPAPTGLVASNITATGATISWTGNDAESYDLAYGVASTFDLENPSTYAVQNTTATSVQLTGLTAETEYKCAVKAHCSAEDESAWSAVYSFTPTAKMTLTVNEGSTYNEYVPFYGYYADDLTQSQFIIPAATLSAMEGADITAMEFYTTTSGYSNVGPADHTFDGSWDVYFKIVDYVEMPYSYEPLDGMDKKVYTGNMVISGSKMVLTFSEPYTYEGGNLMICFNQTASTGYRHTYWRGTTTQKYAARGGYTTSNGNYYFLPTTTFTYIPGATTEYTVNLHVNGVVTEETITSMPAAPTAPAGLTFCGWTTSDITTYATDAPTYVTSLSDEITDLYAVFSYSEMGGTTVWTKVTDFSELNDNDVVIIGAVQNGNSGYTMNEFSEMSSSATCPALPATFSNDGTTITELHEGTTHFTVTKNPYNYGDIYLQGESGKNLSSFWTYNLNIPTGWEEYVGDEFNDIITFDNGNLIISYTEDWDELYVILRNTDQYGGINMRFGVEHIQDGVYYAAYLYKQQGTLTNYYMTSVLTEGTVANATVKNIIVVNPITVSGRLEMNAAGLFRNENVANFVFADGAQFYYTGEESVLATFQKSITGYTNTNDHYYLIANPTDNETVANLVNEEGYDLYTFNPAQALEWHNEKESNALTSGIGYLYANSETVILEFAGVLNPAGSTDIELTFAEAGEGIDFPGFNLIGNPYACKAYVSGYSFYKMVNGELQVNNARTATIAPCEGVFVEATAANQQVNVTTTAPNVGEDDINVNVTKNSRGEVIDRAVISFDGRNDMHKFMMNPANTNIRLAKNGQEYAAISCDAEGEIPVSFKAAEDDTYTITVNANNENTRYLHLIDNLTGMDVDLLANPSYTFNALTSDYAYRFKLVFSMNNVEDNQVEDNNFAFMSDGNLVINNIDGEATLQIVDVLGRVVSTEIVSGSYNKALNLKSGLYILNLNGMTQKIVVE